MWSLTFDKIQFILIMFLIHSAHSWDGMGVASIMVSYQETLGNRTMGQLLMEKRIFKQEWSSCDSSVCSAVKMTRKMLEQWGKTNKWANANVYGRILFAFNLWQPLPTGGHQMDNIDWPRFRFRLQFVSVSCTLHSPQRQPPPQSAWPMLPP